MLSRKNIMPLITAASMMDDFTATSRHLLIDGKVPPAPLPKGTKEYYFSIYGEEGTSSFYDFKCIAINKKNALRKFNNWKTPKQWVAEEL